MPNPQIIYIDCTATYYSGLNTGIQRVVNNVITRAVELRKRFGIEIIPVVAVPGGFKKKMDMPVISRQPPFQQGVRQIFFTSKQRFSKSLWEASSSSSPLVAFLAQKTHAGLLALAFLLRRCIKKIGSIRRMVSKNEGRYLNLTSDDLLIMLDSFWIFDALDEAEKSIASKPVVVSVIYDLIPITHPQYCDQEFVDSFSQLFPRVVELSDGLIGISQTIQKSVGNYVAQQLPDWDSKGMLDFFYLGADFKVDTLSQPDQVSTEISALLRSNPPFFLAVGTIEPRKGYGYLLEGFEILWRHGFTHQLVIVGKVGWLCTDILKRAQELNRSGRPLTLLHDVDDNSLDLLYKKSAAVIFPSYIEGFGLPLVEALVRGKKVLASNIEVFQEIGGPHVSYFKVGNAESLAQSAGEFISTVSINGISSETRAFNGTISWDVSADSLIQKSINIFSKINNDRSSVHTTHSRSKASPHQEVFFSKEAIETTQ
jgi:O-antigen biosynthesis alpha-1,2-rhamnosyltransferase